MTITGHLDEETIEYIADSAMEEVGVGALMQANGLVAVGIDAATLTIIEGTIMEVRMAAE